jgi:hypothetical protein
LSFGVGFEQQRDDDNGKGFVFGAPDFDLFAPEGLDARVEDGFELFASLGIGEDAVGESLAEEPAIGAEDGGAEESPNFREGRLARFDDFAGEEVGVHDRNGAFEQQLVGGGFSHADAAG